MPDLRLLPSAEHLLQMRPIIRQIPFHLRILDHIVADEGGQPRRAEELVGFMKMEMHAIHARALKEIAFAGKRFNRRVPSG